MTSKIKRSLSQKLATYFPSCCDNEIDNCIGISEIWRICMIQDKIQRLGNIILHSHLAHGLEEQDACRSFILRCDRYYLLRNSSFYNSLSVDKKSIQLQDLSLFIVVSWLLVLRTIYQDIVPINTTVISIKIEIEKGQSSHHLRCVDKSEDTILAVIELINRNLKSSFGVILHRTVAQTGNGPAYFDFKL